MNKITLRLNIDLSNDLDYLSNTYNISKAKIIRTILDDYFKMYKINKLKLNENNN